MARPGDQHASLHRWRYQAPLPVFLEDDARTMPDTRGLAEMYWHKVGCDCASCADEIAGKLKVRRIMDKQPATRGSLTAPALPRPLEDLLRGG